MGSMHGCFRFCTSLANALESGKFAPTRQYPTPLPINRGSCGSVRTTTRRSRRGSTNTRMGLRLAIGGGS